MARPMKDISSLNGAYTKKNIEERLERENHIKGKIDEEIIPPDFISVDEIALKKFNELIENLRSVDLITNVDIDLLSAYANCWSLYVRATKALSIQSLVDETENKLGSITRTQNPYIKIQQTYADKLIKLSSLFGLSPADRTRVSHAVNTNSDEPTDELVVLLKSLKG